MKIIAITDKKGSAIDRLARMNEKHLEHLGYKVFTLHPKRPSAEETRDLEQALREADAVDAQYWKSAITARRMFPQFSAIPWVLTHHNEHNINDTDKDHWEWKDLTWAAHVCKNKWQRAELKKNGVDATLIRHAIEWGNFEFNEKLPGQKVVGYVGQMKKVKGVREIAQACRDLGYRLLLVGSISEKDYFDEILKEFEGTIITHYPGSLAVPDADIKSAYAKMDVYCANSDDGTESGTMPILEAMASGVPLVTRRIGLVRDCGKHGENMWIREGGMRDIEDLKTGLKMVMENADIAAKLREAAWRSARQYHPEIQAREYDKVLRAALRPGEASVSVIMATYSRNKELFENIENLREQTYTNFEVVIGDDNFLGGSAEIRSWLLDNRGRFPFPIRHVWTHKIQEGYGLAKARNVATIEATGEYVVICDDRLKMHPNAISAFIAMLEKQDKRKKTWVWGSKGQFKTFVENFSATKRRYLIDAGMFSERMSLYGGMTQEVSGRFGAQGFSFEFCPQAVAEPMFGTHSRSRHRSDIVESKVRLYKMGFQ